MEWIRFPLGQEPKVLTSISEECDAEHCESCPGIFHRDDYPGESIFCVHSCHKVRNQGNKDSRHSRNGASEVKPTRGKTKRPRSEALLTTLNPQRLLNDKTLGCLIALGKQPA